MPSQHKKIPRHQFLSLFNPSLFSTLKTPLNISTPTPNFYPYFPTPSFTTHSYNPNFVQRFFTTTHISTLTSQNIFTNTFFPLRHKRLSAHKSLPKWRSVCRPNQLHPMRLPPKVGWPAV